MAATKATAYIGRSGQLVEAVEDVLPATRTVMDSPRVLVEILPEGIRLAGFSPGLEALRSVPVTTEGRGKIVVDSDALAKSLRTLRHEPVTLTIGDELVIDGSTRISLGALQPVSAPVVPVCPPVITTTVTAFLSAAGTALHASSTDEARPVLTSLCVTGNLIAATDSYRLCSILFEGETTKGKRPLLLPREQVAYLIRRFKRWAGSLIVEASDDSTWVAFHLADRWSGRTATVRMVRLEGEFPDMAKFLADVERDEPNAQITVGNVAELAEAAKAAAGVHPDGLVMIAVKDGETALEVKAKANGGGAETRTAGKLASARSTGSVRFALNGAYLADAAAAFDGKPYVTVKVGSPVKPVRLQVDGLTCLVMPVRMPEAVVEPAKAPAAPKAEAQPSTPKATVRKPRKAPAASTAPKAKGTTATTTTRAKKEASK